MTTKTLLDEQNFIYRLTYKDMYLIDFYFYCSLNLVIVLTYMYVMFLNCVVAAFESDP